MNSCQGSTPTAAICAMAVILYRVAVLLERAETVKVGPALAVMFTETRTALGASWSSCGKALSRVTEIWARSASKSLRLVSGSYNMMFHGFLLDTRWSLFYVALIAKHIPGILGMRG